MNKNISPTGYSVKLKQPKFVIRTLVASDSSEIKWVEFGAGKPLVVSPALGTPLASWQDAISALKDNYKVIFVFPRGGCESPMPQERNALTVERRAEDLVELLEFLQLQDYYMVAHSSGVAPVLVSLTRLTRLPSRVCLVSARYCPGPPIGAENLILRARTDVGFMRLVQTIIAGFSPPSVAEIIKENLSNFEFLETLLYSFEYSRSFRYEEPFRADVPIDFLIAENDPEDVKSSTRELVDSRVEEPWAIIDVSGVGHFFIQDDGKRAAAVIINSLAQNKHQ